MRSGDHIALMQAALGANGFNMNAPGSTVGGSWLLLAGYGALWAGYTAKLSGFLRHQLTLPTHRFLQTLQTRPKANRMIIWLLTVLTGLLPVLTYAGWMMQVGLAMHQSAALWAIGIWLLLLTGAGMLAVDHQLVRPGQVALGSGRWIGSRWALPYVLFYPIYLLRQLPVSTVLTKAGSGLLLTGIYRLYPTDDYDQRLLLIGTVLAIAIHVGIVWRMGAFEETFLRFLPGLPLSRWQRSGGYALTYGLLWLPELGISLWNRPVDISPGYVLLLWLFGWGSLLLIHRLIYARNLPSDALMPWIIGSIIGGTLVIMFGLPAWVFAVGVWVLSLPVWPDAKMANLSNQ